MDENPRQRLARLMAGIPANSSGPSSGGGMSQWMPTLAKALQRERDDKPVSVDPATAQAKWGEATARMPGYQQPYTGPRNDLQTGLPPFVQPGGSLPIDPYMQRAAAPQPAPVPRPAPMPAPPPQSGGQGWGGPEPAPGTMPALQNQPAVDPRYLPEQWQGSFNPRWSS
jgi:hypothetical protein